MPGTARTTWGTGAFDAKMKHICDFVENNVTARTDFRAAKNVGIVVTTNPYRKDSYIFFLLLDFMPAI
jgi:hypothetical protein